MTSLSQNKHVRLQGLKQDVLAFTPEETQAPAAAPNVYGRLRRWLPLAALLLSAAALGFVTLLLIGAGQQRDQLASVEQQQQLILAQQEEFARQLDTLMGPLPEGGNEVAQLRAELGHLRDRVRSHSVEQVRSGRQHQESGEQLAALSESVQRLQRQLASVQASSAPAAPAPVQNAGPDPELQKRLTDLEQRLGLVDQEFKALYRILSTR